MKVAIGIPCMDTVSASFFASLLKQKYADGRDVRYIVETGSVVHGARWRIAQQAIRMGADVLVYYDSDMVLEPETTEMLLGALEGDMPRRQPKDFMTGLYFMRRMPTKPLVLESLDWYMDENFGAQAFADVYEDWPVGSVFEIAGCGFGCCAVRMDLVRKMMEWYNCNIFHPLQGLGEDYSFCWRARRIPGVKLWCDSRIRPGHAGLHVYGEWDYNGDWEEGGI